MNWCQSADTLCIRPAGLCSAWRGQWLTRGARNVAALLFTHFPNDALLILEILPLLFLFFRPLSVRAGRGQRTVRAGEDWPAAARSWVPHTELSCPDDHFSFRSNVKHILALGLAGQHATRHPSLCSTPCAFWKPMRLSPSSGVGV